MNAAITVELQFFLISILCGAILLLVYDIFRILRRLIKHDAFLIAVEDLIFWVGASLFIFAMIYKENNGIIRGFSIMGMAIGMVLYHYILSELIVNVITKLIRALFAPFVFVVNKIKRLLIFLKNKSRKTMNFITIRLKKRSKSVKIALNHKKQIMATKRESKLVEKRKNKQKKDEIKQAKLKQANLKKESKKQASQEQVARKQANKKQVVKKQANKKQVVKKQANKKKVNKKQVSEKQASKIKVS